jgi:hypothetical protein
MSTDLSRRIWLKKPHISSKEGEVQVGRHGLHALLIGRSKLFEVISSEDPKVSVGQVFDLLLCGKVDHEPPPMSPSAGVFSV